MLLFVETKRSRRQYFAAWFASCAGHTSTSRRGKNSRSTVVCDEAAVGHRHTKLPDLALVINEKLASSSGKCGNQCCSSARRSAALGKARSWSSFFSVCLCFTEASGLTLGLVYSTDELTLFNFKPHGSHLPHCFRCLAYSRRSCGFIPRGWP
jgi:hypothetical protein